MEVRLRFGPGSSAGFTPAGIAAFNNLRPAAVVRELLQNAYDAAREAGQAQSVVRFCLDTMPTDDIPGIEAYKAAFKAAIATQKEMGGIAAKARSVVKTINAALDKAHQNVLVVLDNGIGLDDRRMTALLSDGVSAKGDHASGTFGNGHSVAIPTSDLRYLLYGGVLENGDAICAGHAVLAAHAPTDARSRFLCSGDGFFVRRFLNGRDGQLFEFAKGDQIPNAIQTHLDDVLENGQHGSAVIIPAFNNFKNQKQSLWDMVAQATACNFFHALVEDKLIVHVEDKTGDKADMKTLDSGNVAKVLIANRDMKKARAFLSGEKAYNAYHALTHGVDHIVKTSYGSLHIRLFNKPTGSPRVDLCRNGMWITDDKGIPGFYYKFRDRRPFHALLLLEPNDDELYRLVREAEGPLHDRFDLKSMPRKDRRACRAVFEDIRKWIHDNTDEIADTSFAPDDFLMLNFGETDDESWGTPQTVTGRPSGRKLVRTEDQQRVRQKESRRIQPTGRSGRQNVNSFVSAVAVPVAPDRRRVAIAFHRECRQAEFELSVDENIDSTCDRVARDREAEVILRDVAIDGKKVDESRLMRRDGAVVGVRLGNFVKGQEVVVDVSYTLPSYFGSLPASSASLLVEVRQQARRGSD